MLNLLGIQIIYKASHSCANSKLTSLDHFFIKNLFFNSKWSSLKTVYLTSENIQKLSCIQMNQVFRYQYTDCDSKAFENSYLQCWQGPEIRKRNICKPTSCDVSGFLLGSLKEVFSFVFSLFFAFDCFVLLRFVLLHYISRYCIFSPKLISSSNDICLLIPITQWI